MMPRSYKYSKSLENYLDDMCRVTKGQLKVKLVNMTNNMKIGTPFVVVMVSS